MDEAAYLKRKGAAIRRTLVNHGLTTLVVLVLTAIAALIFSTWIQTRVRAMGQSESLPAFVSTALAGALRMQVLPILCAVGASVAILILVSLGTSLLLEGLFTATTILLRMGALRVRSDAVYESLITEPLRRIFKHTQTGMLVVATVWLLALTARFGLNLRVYLVALYAILLGYVVVVHLVRFRVEWTTVRPRSPSILLYSYGRKSALGDLAYWFAGVLTLVVFVRVGVPVWFRTTERVCVRANRYAASSVLNSGELQKAQEWAKQHKGKEFAVPALKFVPSEAAPAFLAKLGLEPRTLRRLTLNAFFWLVMTGVALNLFVPMVLYNRLRPGKRPLRKIMKTIVISVLTGLAMEYLPDLMFDIPPPPLAATSAVSLVVFTAVLTWIYES